MTWTALILSALLPTISLGAFWMGMRLSRLRQEQQSSLLDAADRLDRWTRLADAQASTISQTRDLSLQFERLASTIEVMDSNQRALFENLIRAGLMSRKDLRDRPTGAWGSPPERREPSSSAPAESDALT